MTLPFFYWDAISPNDAFGFFNDGVISEATAIPCFRSALNLYDTTTLAIEPFNLNLDCQPGQTTLQWIAVGGEHSARFELQRSTDATNWYSIYFGVTMPGRRSYAYNDKTTSDGALYRLRSIAADGSERFSPVRIADCGSLPELKIWPNPTRSEAWVQLFGEGDDGILHWSLQDMQGRLLRQSEQFAKPGLQEAVILSEGLPAGLYHLSIQTTKGRTAHRILALVR